MISLEREIREYLKYKNIEYKDHTNSTTNLDFQVEDFFIDAKEKRQKYNENNWKTEIPQEHLFILNEADVVKALAHGYNSCFIVRDNIEGMYHLFPMIDLCCMPKQRVDRKIYSGDMVRKWLVDLRNARFYGRSLDTVMAIVMGYKEEPPVKGIPPFVDEIVPIRGTVRRKQDFTHDFHVTR